MKNIKYAENYKGKHGIYYILHITSGKLYVGSSVDIRRRIKAHYTDLISNSHRNSYLQNTWNKTSESGFLFGVLEILSNKNYLLKREQYWMDFLETANREKGFNLTPTAGSNLGFKKSKEQIENSIIAIRGTRNTILTAEEASLVKALINNGKNLREISKKMGVEYDTIRSIRRGRSFKYIDPQINYDANFRAKLEKEDVIEIKKMLNAGIKVKVLADDFNVSHRTISAIKNEINWKGVGERIIIPKRKSRKELDYE